MKRIDTYITIPQIEQMKQLATETGLTVAELIRRAIDLYLENTKLLK